MPAVLFPNCKHAEFAVVGTGESNSSFKNLASSVRGAGDRPGIPLQSLHWDIGHGTGRTVGIVERDQLTSPQIQHFKAHSLQVLETKLDVEEGQQSKWGIDVNSITVKKHIQLCYCESLSLRC